jgi:histidinol-phosphate aminotransferase
MGFDVLPSAANFLFVTHEKMLARSVFEALRAKGVIVRYFDAPRINNYLRISVGDEGQCESLIAALSDILAA